MRIINPFEGELEGPEVRLSKMASSEDQWEALKGQKMLELLRHLEAQGPAPKAFGYVWSDELWLSPYNISNPASVKVWVDRYDYSPLRDGLPETHYRIQIKRRKSVVTRDSRANSPKEAEQMIWEAFGWSP